MKNFIFLDLPLKLKFSLLPGIDMKKKLIEKKIKRIGMFKIKNKKNRKLNFIKSQIKKKHYPKRA